MAPKTSEYIILHCELNTNFCSEINRYRFIHFIYAAVVLSLFTSIMQIFSLAKVGEFFLLLIFFLRLFFFSIFVKYMQIDARK